MTESRYDASRVLFCSLFDSKGGLSRLLALTMIGLGLLVGPAHPLVVGQTPVAIRQASILSYANVASNGALNLTDAMVNATSSFQTSWSSNTTTAQSRINSTDAPGETASAIWRLDPSLIAQAQIIKYDFTFATQVSKPGSSGPNITASIGLTSSDYVGWYAQSRTPIYSNKTETVSVTNVVGTYPNSSLRDSLLFQNTQVSNSQSGSSAVLFQKEYPEYAAGDAVPHQYTIEIDRQSNRTIWIADNTIVATFTASFVPSNLVFVASASGTGNLAVATLKDPVQTTIPSTVTITATTSGNSAGIGNITITTGQSTSLQNQIDHLKSQVGNLTSQNSQLQAKTSQWFAQWWAGLVWAVLGAGLGGVFFVTGTKLITRRKAGDASAGEKFSCLQCGRQMPLGATFCGECGNSLSATGWSCPGCGQQMPPASLYCGECGTQISSKDQPGQNRAETSAAEDVEDGTWR